MATPQLQPMQGDRRLICVLAFALLVAPAAASAGESPSDITEIMQQAIIAEEALEYEEAASIWAALISRRDLSTDQRLDANFNAGRVARIRGQDMEARMHFLYVLKLQPEFELPPKTSPKIANYFELVRQEVLAEAATSAANAQTTVLQATENSAAPSAPRTEQAPANDHAAHDEPADPAPAGGLPLMLIGGAGTAAIGAAVVAIGVWSGLQALDAEERALDITIQAARSDVYDTRDLHALVANVSYASGGILLATGGALIAADLLGAAE